MREIQDLVRAFHLAAGEPVGKEPDLMPHREMLRRVDMLHEEVQELATAAHTKNLPDAVDALADITYLALGGFVGMGVQADPVMRLVAESNMAKRFPDGTFQRQPSGKIAKPPGWQPPAIAHELICQAAALPRRHVVALLGKAFSGKTTAARHLVGSKGAVRLSFAGPLKLIAQRLFDLSDEQVYGALKEEADPRYGRSPRAILQDLGKLGRDLLGEDVWVRAALRRVEEGPPGVYVIDDCRYPNEAEIVACGGRNWTGQVVKITRPPEEWGVRTHESEEGVDQVLRSAISAHVFNDGSATALGPMVEAALGWS